MDEKNEIKKMHGEIKQETNKMASFNRIVDGNKDFLSEEAKNDIANTWCICLSDNLPQQIKGDPFSIYQGILRAREMGISPNMYFDLLNNNLLICKEYSRPENLSLALHTAKNLNIDPLMFLMNTYFVRNQMTLSSKLMGGLLNASGKIVGGARFETFYIDSAGARHEKKIHGWQDIEVTMIVTDKEGGFEIKTRANYTDYAFQGNNKTPKSDHWASRPEVMLRYKAMALLIRTSYPEVLGGLYTKEELEEEKTTTIKEVGSFDEVVANNDN